MLAIIRNQFCSHLQSEFLLIFDPILLLVLAVGAEQNFAEKKLILMILSKLQYSGHFAALVICIGNFLEAERTV